MAYQGKFSQPRNTEEALRLKAEAKKRQAAAEAAAQKEAVPAKQEAVATPVKQETAVTPVKQEAAPAPVKQNPAPVKQEAPARAKPTGTPAKKNGRKKKKKKKANRTITIIFYTVYVVMVAAIVGGLLYANNWLEGWLLDYQASQPNTRCEEVFAQTFSQPDWEALYEMSGIQDTQYEGSEAFAAYMEAKLAGGEITYIETSAGLSGGHKYLLKLGEETLGYFTLVDQAPASAEVRDWQLGEVKLNYAYTESVTIQKLDGQTVYVNGVALTDDHTIQIGTTAAEKYLSEGLRGPRICTQYLDGLMSPAEVTATDENGNPVEVSYNAEQDIYVVQTEANTISDEEYERALKTAQTYALRMIEKVSANELAKYFDARCQSYKTIISIDPWMQEWFFRSYEFGEESITGYYRYSDDLFSVHVDLSMFVTRTDDTVKEYIVDHSFFFEKQSGVWKCINMINVDIQEQTAVVRLTFKSGDDVLYTNMFAEDIDSITAPLVTAPEGKVFAGWYRQEIADDGSVTYTLVFTPAEDGTITLPAGTKLEPMTLYALFENAEITDGGNA